MLHLLPQLNSLDFRLRGIPGRCLLMKIKVLSEGQGTDNSPTEGGGSSQL